MQLYYGDDVDALPSLTRSLWEVAHDLRIKSFVVNAESSSEQLLLSANAA